MYGFILMDMQQVEEWVWKDRKGPVIQRIWGEKFTLNGGSFILSYFSPKGVESMRTTEAENKMVL